MSSIQSRPTRIIAPSLQAILDTAQDREAFDALLATVGAQCEFCGRMRKLDPHHVAQGFRERTEFLVQLLCLICRQCHDDIHSLPAKHGRAMGLAIIYHAGRGNNLELLWAVTANHSPSEEVVEAWIERLQRTQKPTWRE